MFNISCAHCGKQHQQDEARVPPSGIVIKCPSCGKAMIVMPPKTEDLLPFAGRPAAATEQGIGAPPRSPAPPVEKRKLGGGPALAAFDAEGEVDLPAPKPARPPEIVDLPAPKGAKPSRPGSQAELPDLLAPVGPTPTRGAALEVPDLLAPVGPSPTRGPALPELDLPDLLAPVGATPTRGLADLPTPVGPVPTKGLADLPTPVGPVPTKGLADLPTPVGPVPTKGLADLLTPVGPVATKGGIDLPTPVGPVATKGGIDLPTPVGPVATKGGIDLPTPVGPVPTRGLADLPTPVGPIPSNLPRPVGNAPTKNIDLPAPKGFFDDIPAARSPTATRTGAPAVPSLDLEDLDVVPAGASAPPPPAATTRTKPPTPPPFSMDGLDLMPPDPAAPQAAPPSLAEAAPRSSGLSFGEVDLPPGADDPHGGEEAAAGLVSFAKPSAAAREAASAEPGAPPPADRGDALDIGPTKRKLGTIAEAAQPVARVPVGEEEAPARRGEKPKKVKTPEQLRRQRILTGAILFLLLAGGAGFYVYTQVDTKILGIKTIPFKERQERIREGLLSARKLMASDDPGHWDKAAAAASGVLKLDGRHGDALGLLIQAQLAAVIEEGLAEQKLVDAADKHITDGVKAGVKNVEFEKAQALRWMLEGKASDAKRSLAGLAQRHRADPDIPLYQGWIAMELRDYTAAKSAFETSVQRTPGRTPSVYGLGRAHAALGDPAKAREQYEKVLTKRPDRKHFGAWLGMTELIPRDRAGTREKELSVMVERAPERETAHPRDLGRAWVLYADEAMAQKNFDRAAERYRRAAEIDPRNVDALVGVAITSIEQGKKDDARARLQSVLGVDPTHVGALVGLTRVALLDRSPTEAFGFITQAVKLTPENARVQLWLGHVLAADPNLDPALSAEAAYKKSIELEPTDYDAFVALARLLSRTPGREADAVAVLAPVEKAAMEDSILANTLGEAYLSVKDATLAEKWFRQALAANANNVTARSNLGAALELHGKLADALVEYEAAYRVDPKTEEITLRLAAAYEKSKRHGEAHRLYQTLLAPDPGRTPSVSARAAAGRFWARRGDAVAAKEQGVAILDVDARYPAGLFLRGFGHLSEGKYNDAQKDITDAIQIDPQAQYWDALGRVFEKQNLLSESLAAFEKAIAFEPAYVAPRLGRARIRMLRAEYGKALGELAEAAKLEPENADVWARMGESHYQLRELEKAQKAFQEALRRDPKRADVLFMLGRAIDEDPRGSASAAIGHLREATRLAADLPQDPEWLSEAYRILGFAYRETGNRGAACIALREYLEIAPQNDGLRVEAERVVLSCQ